MKSLAQNRSMQAPWSEVIDPPPEKWSERIKRLKISTLHLNGANASHWAHLIGHHNKYSDEWLCRLIEGVPAAGEHDKC